MCLSAFGILCTYPRIDGLWNENPNAGATAMIGGMTSGSAIDSVITASNIRQTSSTPISTGLVYVKDSGKKGWLTPPSILLLVLVIRLPITLV